ncbi:hypothetical protein EZV62_011642 [Acer yangbiense]|uniref:MADS-box domain-containing protein n=1 Tax=Acer yangbiense TaxID=1000413 RepID=A0A5C7I6K2_9ROSI|nr:hypothetical protein EZV62_011642 [Acer yangbiense]
MEVSKPTKQGGGRRKIEMKKVEEGSKRSVTFTKRRKGLFNKAFELSELSGTKIAVFVISEQAKPYSWGDVDAIIDQYLTGKVSDSGSESRQFEGVGAAFEVGAGEAFEFEFEWLWCQLLVD